jgi:type IV secretion system protein VirD4
VDALLKASETPTPDLLELASQDKHAKRFLMKLINTAEDTLGSIDQTVHTHIIKFLADPAIEDVLLKRPAITPDMLESGQSIYLQIPLNKIELNQALFTLILQQFIRHFERRPEQGNIATLLLIDEFARFGKLHKIDNALSTLRSRKVTICLILQSFAQLDLIYGKNLRTVITDNCDWKVILKATDPDTQKQLSAMIGSHEVERISITTTPTGQSKTVSIQEKPKVRPEEFGTLDNDLIVLGPKQYDRFKKMPSYAVTYVPCQPTQTL